MIASNDFDSSVSKIDILYDVSEDHIPFKVYINSDKIPNLMSSINNDRANIRWNNMTDNNISKYLDVTASMSCENISPATATPSHMLARIYVSVIVTDRDILPTQSPQQASCVLFFILVIVNVNWCTLFLLLFSMYYFVTIHMPMRLHSIHVTMVYSIV